MPPDKAGWVGNFRYTPKPTPSLRATPPERGSTSGDEIKETEALHELPGHAEHVAHVHVAIAIAVQKGR